MPRFVVLFHETPSHDERPSHWDLMLEDNGTLRTWALDDEPQMGESTRAVAIKDHRLDFLEYEGELSRGRGTVQRVDRGSFDWVLSSSTRLVLRLRGTRWQVTAQLDMLDEHQNWRLTLGKDCE